MTRDVYLEDLKKTLKLPSKKQKVSLTLSQINLEILRKYCKKHSCALSSLIDAVISDFTENLK